MKQVTIRVEAFATVMVADDWAGDVDTVPMRLDVFNYGDDEGSNVVEVVETEITAKEVTHAVGV